MKKWYKQPYFDRRNWILENFDKLGLNCEEATLILIIDFAKDSKRTISYDYLMSKMSLDSKQIDKIIAKLVSKNYLAINPTNKGVSFDIDGLFEFDPDKYEISENANIYNIAEDLIKRPLSPIELQKLSDLINEFKPNKIIDAFRVAEAYRKSSLAYVEAILRNEK